jgi:serine/threonine protein kinase
MSPGGSTNNNQNSLKKVTDELENDHRVTMIQFSQLKLTAKLAAGTDGIVYKALWGSGKMPVAVKRLVKLEMHSESKSVLAKFKKESKILSSLSHPNIVKFFGLSLVEGNHENPPSVFLVTELCHAALDTVDFNKESRKSGQLLDMVKQIVSGMAYLHSPQVGILHRDLKMQNVLVNEEHNEAKICDFGLASVKIIDSQSMSVMVGTPAYMAPELINSNLDHRLTFSNKVDVYSFAIMLWSMWCQRKPYVPLAKGVSSFMLMSRIAKGFRPEIPSDIPPELGALIQDCWAQEAEDRPSFLEVEERICSSKDGLGMYQPSWLNFSAKSTTPHTPTKAVSIPS